MATLINGRAIAANMLAQAQLAARKLTETTSVTPGLAVVIVGDDPASHTYVASKGRAAKECGFVSFQHTLPADTTQEGLSALVDDLNRDPMVHGVLVQLPLPGHLRSADIIQSISPEKDVDGLHAVNAGRVAIGDFANALISCTPAGAMVLVRSIHGDDLSGLSAVVIGRSNLFGKPMSALLLAANATVTTAHSRTRDLAAVCRNADILVAAVGRPEMVGAGWIKPGATVIDVGINRIPAAADSGGKSRLVGDVAFAQCEPIAGAITPVPGGVGPITIAMLMANTVTAAYRRAGMEMPRVSGCELSE